MKILPVLGNQEGVREYWAEMQNYNIEVDEKNPEYIVILGGDGTFLGAERDYFHLGVPFVGVGFGHVNFLLNRSLRSPKQFVEKLERNEWIKFPIFEMKAEIVTKTGVKHGVAFNDIYLKSLNPAGVVRLELQTKEYDCLKVEGDGIIVATPQGSTAYNRNAGGTILPLGSTLWCLTGICTQKRLRVTVAQQNISIEVKSKDAVLVTDNKIFHEVERVTIMPSNRQSVICFDKGENFEQRRYEI